MNLDRFSFKAKKINSKKWLYAGLDDSEELLHWLLRDENNSKYDPAWIDPETLCQCTGLKDSGGTPIFENDYVEILLNGSGEIWEEAALVEYSRLGFVYTCKDEEQPLHHLEFQMKEGLVKVYVVGNNWNK